MEVFLSNPRQFDGLVVAITFSCLALCNRKAKHIGEGTSRSKESILWHSKEHAFNLGDPFISNQ